MDPTIALPPGRLSTLSYSAWPTPFEGIATKSYDFEACPTWGLNSAFNSTMAFNPGEYLTVGPPWNPIILPPQELLDLDPAWKLCEWVTDGGEYGFFYGAFDPPHILTPMTGMVDPMSTTSQPMTGSVDPVTWTNNAAPAATEAPFLPPTSIDPKGSGITSIRHSASNSLNEVYASQDPAAIATPGTNRFSQSIDPSTGPHGSMSTDSIYISTSLLAVTQSRAIGYGSQYSPKPNTSSDLSKVLSILESPSSATPRTSAIEPIEATNAQVSVSNTQGLGAIVMSALGGFPSTHLVSIHNPIISVQVTFITIISNGPTVVESKETLPAQLSAGSLESAWSYLLTSVQSIGDPTTGADPMEMAINDTTLTLGGPGATLSGMSVSLGTAGLVLGSITFDLTLIANSLVTINGHTLAVTNVHVPSDGRVRTSASDDRSIASTKSALSGLSNIGITNTQGSLFGGSTPTHPSNNVETYTGDSSSKAPLSGWTVVLVIALICKLSTLSIIGIISS